MDITQGGGKKGGADLWRDWTIIAVPAAACVIVEAIMAETLGA